MKNHLVIEVSLAVLVIVFAVLFINKSVTVERIEIPLAAMPGPTVSGPEFCVGGVCQYNVLGTCANATTTLFYFKNPWNATSTVEFAQIEGLMGTTSSQVKVGTSTVASLLAVGSGLSPSLINVASVATSTKFFLVNSTLGSGGESASAGAESLKRIVVKPAEYVIGHATGTANSADQTGITGNSNTFTCTYKLRWVK